MRRTQETARRLRWLVLDHLLIIVLALMTMTVFGVLLVGGRGERESQRDYDLQRSLPKEP
jgi:hypothetical protein